MPQEKILFNFVLDTSVMIHNFKSFLGNVPKQSAVIIPPFVMRELKDLRKKNLDPEVRDAARYCLKHLNQIKESVRVGALPRWRIDVKIPRSKSEEIANTFDLTPELEKALSRRDLGILHEAKYFTDHAVSGSTILITRDAAMKRAAHKNSIQTIWKLTPKEAEKLCN